jgi:hypothetical protein
MSVGPRVRKFMLTAHITTSVGWLGALAGYLALDIAAATGGDVETVRAAYQGMDLSVRFVLIPLALAALFTGIVQSLATTWGLFRHYWVVVSLLLTLVATGVLLLEARTVRYLAEQAASTADPRGLPGTLLHSVGGLAVLLTITALNMYKPKGLTRYGWRKRRTKPGQRSAALVLALVAGMTGCGTSGAESGRRAEVSERSRKVMPFDLERTTHHFTKSADGGVETVLADDPADEQQIRLIREHLTKEYARFRQGDWGDPATIHGRTMPGIQELSRGYSRIRMTYGNVRAGARIVFSTSDPAMVKALHAWFDAQVSDHGEHAEPE